MEIYQCDLVWMHWFRFIKISLYSMTAKLSKSKGKGVSNCGYYVLPTNYVTLEITKPNLSTKNLWILHGWFWWYDIESELVGFKGIVPFIVPKFWH